MSGAGLLIGCIADDMTGATDLANNLVRAGMRVVQTTGVPSSPGCGNAQAAVIALKSRTVPAHEAVEQSIEALRWLREEGARQIYFKYCSTFDSTPSGNIGPVLDALSAALDCRISLSTPAFPDNQRTVVKGHLFVGDELLSDSGMRHHPLTPMTDSNLVRVLQAQSRMRVGLADYRVVRGGPAGVQEHLNALAGDGIGVVIADAMTNADLMVLGQAVQGMRLVSGGSGLAIGLPQNFGIQPSSLASELPPARGYRAIVSGSCSLATNRQVLHAIRNGLPSMPIDPLRIAAGEDVVHEVLDWARPRLGDLPLLVYSTADPQAVRATQVQLGVEHAGTLVERTIARIARGLVPDGHPKLLHSWPPKLLRAGRGNYEPSVVVTRRAAASFNR